MSDSASNSNNNKSDVDSKLKATTDDPLTKKEWVKFDDDTEKVL
jgi:hypothetical protein